MKTLYLHIGMPKTGTSSIQKFLSTNRSALGQYGYCYPKLSADYVCNNRNGYFMVGKRYKEDGTRDKKLEKQYLKDGMAQVDSYFEVFDNVILSEETVWRYFDPAFHYVFPYLKEHAAEHSYQIRIIIYLRRQDEFVTSLWKQHMKQTKLTMYQPFEQELNGILEKEAAILNYASRLDTIAAIFGRESLIVRRYEPKSWVNGSIIDDFLDCVGLKLTDAFTLLPQNMNPSLSENMAEIKRIINKDASFTQDENAYLGQFLRELSGDSSTRYPCSMLSMSETQELLDKFKDENERAAKEYIADGKPLFFGEIKDLPKWQADNPYFQEDMIRFFSTACVSLHRENEELREALATARNGLDALREKQNRELAELKQSVASLQGTVKKEQFLFRSFKHKLKHPFQTLWNRIFHRN